jgi:hypothetical protein
MARKLNANVLGKFLIGVILTYRKGKGEKLLKKKVARESQLSAKYFSECFRKQIGMEESD